MRRWVMVLVGLAVAAGPALGAPVDGRTAKKMLFSPRGSQSVIRKDAGLSASDVQTLQVLFSLSARKIDDKVLAAAGIGGEQGKAVIELLKTFQDAKYYGAMAASPGDGLISQATNLAVNMHTPEAAAAAALKFCNARKKAKAKCVVVADILPRNWKAEPLMLNQDATAAMRDYLRGRGPKAMAISPVTGVWSIAKGEGAALAAKNDCLNKSQPLGATDCIIAVEDK